MHLQDITKLLDLQDIVVVKFIYGYEDTVYITVEPAEYIQTCPCCKSSNVIRLGSSGYRKIIHLPMFHNKTIIKAPKIRMSRKECYASFSWNYSFVSGKSQYNEITILKQLLSVSGALELVYW